LLLEASTGRPLFRLLCAAPIRSLSLHRLSFLRVLPELSFFVVSSQAFDGCQLFRVVHAKSTSSPVILPVDQLTGDRVSLTRCPLAGMCVDGSLIQTDRCTPTGIVTLFLLSLRGVLLKRTLSVESIVAAHEAVNEEQVVDNQEQEEEQEQEQKKVEQVEWHQWDVCKVSL
jgi:hypothetical protein